MDISISFPVVGGRKQVDAQVGAHRIVTDQPVALGGDDSGPAPFDLFLASIATCAGIYVLGFCQARSIPTEGLTLLQHVENDPTTRLPTRIELEIRLPAGFPPKYREAVVRAADGCKVKKTLLAPPTIEVVSTVVGVGEDAAVPA